MIYKHFFSVSICLFFSLLVCGQQKKDSLQTVQISNTVAYQYSKPKFFDKFKYLPKDIAEFGKFTVQKENLKWSLGAIGATAILVPLDQEITDESMKFGKQIGMKQTHSYSKIGPAKVIPNDINSALYYAGNGGTTLLLSGTFYAIGLLGKDYRAINTSSELIEVLMSVGVATQTIKRITGRQSPDAAIKEGNRGGAWHLFPSFSDYQTNTYNFDAMPSGHLATLMATVTVIATNYPEIKWIRPVGYTLMAAMSYEMMNSKVHWFSDYPIAILIGYVMGKTVANRRIKKIDTTKEVGVFSNLKTNFSMGNVGYYKTYGVTLTF